MFRNYLKVSLRYLQKNKGYTAINILGLAVGITACILIMLFVRSEWSYDKFHSKADRIYRMWQHEKYQGEDFISTSTPLKMASALQANIPDIESTCRIWSFNPMIRSQQQSFTESVRMVDSTFLNIFDFEILEGDARNIFPTSNSIVITPEMSKKYFGNEKAIGKTLELINDETKLLYTVTAVIKEAPEPSSIRYSMLIPFSNSRSFFSANAHNSWFNVFLETYVLLKPTSSVVATSAKFDGMMKQQLGENYTPDGFRLFMQPITAIHLDNTLPAGNEPVSNPKYAYILATIGILILFVACINFITLSIGKSATRALEVGVRKALGAERKQLIRQFWGEAFLVTICAVIIGIALSTILVQPFNQLINRQLEFQFDLVFILFALALIAVIAIIAGFYPAIVLSRFNPVEVLKGKLRLGNTGGWLRQSLVVGQFVASIAMIICTMVISDQMDYVKEKDLGFNEDKVIIVPTNKTYRDGTALAKLYRTELMKNPSVKDVSVALYSFAQSPWVGLGFTDDKKVYKAFQYNTVDAQFIKTMDMKVVRGRSFDESNPADATTAAVVNEAFVKEFQLGDAVGKKLPGNFDQQIIGVVKDFHFESLHTPIRPLMMTMTPDSVFARTENVSIQFPPQPRISIKLQGGISESIKILETAWKKVAPGQDFEYQFLDESLAESYQEEQRTSRIVSIASMLSIFIACLGLFGLATLTVIRRTKEIGIRKVLGASVVTIMTLLSKDFLKLILIAAVIASPIAWWFMSDWLKDFEYRTRISMWLFVIAGIAAIAIALVTVSLQAMKAALANPVKSLRTE